MSVKQVFLRDRKKIMALFCLMVVFAMSFVLFYRYIFELQTSDFPAHIKRSLAGRGYSINLLLFPLFYKLTGSYFGIVFLMSLFTVGTVIATALFLKCMSSELHEERDLYSLIPLSASLIFISKLCIPEWSPYYYKGSISTQPWHNSTYIEMRLFGILALLMYFKIRKEYLTKIRRKELLLFFLALSLTNISKPNFVIAFSPVMLFVLVRDFLLSRGKSFKNAFFFGLAVLISCGVLLLQYSAMFPSEGASGVAFSVTNAVAYLSKDRKFPLHVLLNFAFPVYVAYLLFRNRKQLDLFSRQLSLEMWAMNILSFLVSIFIIETGPRQADGNFEWGNFFFAFALFAVSLLMLKKMKREEMISDGEYATARLIYLAHVVLGIFYFGLLIIGYLSWII